MDDTVSIHFKFGHKIFSFNEDNCIDDFAFEIHKILNDAREGVEIVIKSSTSEIIRFIPERERVFLKPCPLGYIISQYKVKLITLPPNDISSPYIIEPVPLSK